MQQMNMSNTGWDDSADTVRQYQEGYQHDDYEPHMRDARDWKVDKESEDAVQRERIRQDILTEMQVARGTGSQGRLALAIASLIALTCLFGFFFLALVFAHLTSGDDIALGYGIVFCCIAVIAINGYYNWASSVITRGRRPNNGCTSKS